MSHNLAQCQTLVKRAAEAGAKVRRCLFQEQLSDYAMLFIGLALLGHTLMPLSGRYLLLCFMSSARFSACFKTSNARMRSYH